MVNVKEYQRYKVSDTQAFILLRALSFGATVRRSGEYHSLRGLLKRGIVVVDRCDLITVTDAARLFYTQPLNHAGLCAQNGGTLWAIKAVS